MQKTQRLILYPEKSIHHDQEDLTKRHRQPAAEKEEIIQCELYKADAGGEKIKRICKDYIPLAPVAKISGLFKETPKVQRETLQRQK